jgi:hypothetical protein
LYAVIAHFGTPAGCAWWRSTSSGALRTVLEEASDTRLQLNVYSYNRPAVAILPGQDTAVWFSQRDGWGHLYRVRLSDGKVLRQLTRGRWAVRDLLGVDAAVAGRTSAPAASTVATLTCAACTVSLQGGPISAWPPMATTTWPMPVPARCSAGARRRRCRRRWLSGGYRFPSRPATTHRAAGQR